MSTDAPVLTIVLGGASLALLAASIVAAVMFLTSELVWPALAAVALVAVNGWMFRRAVRIVLKGRGHV